MIYTYSPQGTCSNLMRLEIEDGIVKSAEIFGGCSGNLQGICRLITGMPARDVMMQLRGIRCGCKATSCPDQLSIAIGQALAQGEAQR